jgi:hemoglobin
MEREIYVPPVNPGQVKGPSREIFARMGEENIERMLEDFYLELARGSPALRALFPADMVAASRKSAAFFIGLLGGPPRYHERHGNPMMRARHMPFAIDESLRDEWLACFNRVLDEAPARYDFPPEHLASFREFLAGFSLWMVNTRSDL